MSWIAKLALQTVGPYIINQLLKQIDGEKVREWITRGADELIEFVRRIFGKLAEHAQDSSTEIDDKAVAGALSVVETGIHALVMTGGLLDVLEELAEALVSLAERTDNELDDALAQGVLDAIRNAKD